MPLSDFLEKEPVSKLQASLESFDELQTLNDDFLDDDGDDEFNGLSKEVDSVVSSLESIIDNGQCSLGTATLIYASLESISDRIGYKLNLPSLEGADVNPEEIHDIAMEAFGDIIGRFIQAYVNKYKTFFAALIILFQGRAKLAMRHKRRIGEYRQEWKEKEPGLYRINQVGNAWGESTATFFFRNNKVETRPFEALVSDMTFYRWFFGPYSKSLEDCAKNAGRTISSVHLKTGKDVDALVAKVIKLKRPTDLFDTKYLNHGPLLLGNLGFKMRTTRSPKPAGRTDDYVKLAEMSNGNRVVPDVFPLKVLIDPSPVWKDLIVKNQDVLKYLDNMEESCDILINYVEKMRIHTAPYWDLSTDIKGHFSDIDHLTTQQKRALKQITGYADSIRYQHFWLVKQMSNTLTNLNLAGTHFISRLIARSK